MEPSFLLGTFTALVDRIVNLEKTKLQDKKTLFNEIVKPLFEELEPVASNYKDIFWKAKQVAKTNSQKKLQKAMLQIVEEREVMALARIKVREMAIQIAENIKDEEVAVFANAVNGYFYNTAKSYGSTRTIFLLRRFEKQRESGEVSEINAPEKEVLVEYIDEVLKDLEKSWKTIVQSYERLKIYSVSPTKFIKKNTTKKSNSQ